MKITVNKDQIKLAGRQKAAQFLDRNESLKNLSKNRTLPLPSKADHLFSIINTFHDSLCGLPLNKLIAADQPHQWIDEQTKTLVHLFSKLKKYESSKQHDYYKAKLQSV